MRRRRTTTALRVALALGAALPGTTTTGAERGLYAEPAVCGDRLVFVSEGDLWTARLEGGDAPIVAHRLTSGDGEESRPAFSPDGTRIAFSAQYDGNTDVYVMPADGGEPRRLTFHPHDDLALGWTPDGKDVLFASPRSSPHGRNELWRVDRAGGMPAAYGFGPCAQVSASSTGRRLAFTPYSNAHWHWKGYRGGRAPEIWIADLPSGTFSRLTDDVANDHYPMWLLGRVHFLSDRDGTPNLYSDRAAGGDLRRHTRFDRAAGGPTDVESYDVRWPSADPSRGGHAIVFVQGGDLALLDVRDDRVRRLDVRLASDRVARRERFAAPMPTATGFALAPDGGALIVESRGELLRVDVETGAARQLTRSSFAREWGATWIDPDSIALVTDATGEQNVAGMPADGSERPSLMTDDREAWLFPPVASPDGRWLAFADKSLRLHLLSLVDLLRTPIDLGEAQEITDYRFSPDSQWLAYTKPMPNGIRQVMLHSLRTGRQFPVGDGLHDDREPRWDPAGRYLYMLSTRHLDPVVGTLALDYEHVFTEATVVIAVPLASTTPPPLPGVADAAGLDLEAWARRPAAVEPAPDAPANGAGALVRVDTEGMAERHVRLGLAPGNLSDLAALHGSVCVLSTPTAGMLSRRGGADGIAGGAARLLRFDVATGETTTLAEAISSYAVSADRTTVAHPSADGFVVLDPASPGARDVVSLAGARLRVDVAAEWTQILDEAWRLQRDFYWAPTMRGVDWPAMRDRYAALLPRVGTRAELNDVIGEMVGELRTSHAYIRGGEPRDRPARIPVGLLGADVAVDGAGFVIERVVRGAPWDPARRGPLAAPHLGISPGTRLLAIDDVPLEPGMNLHDVLQDRAGRRVRLRVLDDAGERTVTIEALEDDRPLRYADWVDANRRRVEEASDGTIGYVHVPDMGGAGLVEFSRAFYPQVRKAGLIVDVRDNGGGIVSQMIISRLARRPIAFFQPRHGARRTYPYRAPRGHLAAIIDEFAGSDGDIFPEVFRLRELGPLVGTRTWGGVVAIRSDKPFVDLGMSTQPEFAWWEPRRGWALENAGVAPDVEVPYTPAHHAAGVDPQLERTIEILLDRIERDPPDWPEPPPVP